MNEVVSLLVCDFFKSQYRSSPLLRDGAYYKNLLMKRPSVHQLKVFLCGKEFGNQPVDKHFDKRFQIKKFINERMGCASFLGEDIEEIKKPTLVNKDALTIEVSEAETSDLIFIFLESPGTTSELTAFALSPKIVDKVVVFNDEQYRNSGKPSFLTVGPLKLLEVRNPGSIIFYDPKKLEGGLSSEVISHLDGAISKVWFKKCLTHERIDADKWNYQNFIVFSAISALFPVTVDALKEILRHRLFEDEIQDTIVKLRRDKMLHLRKGTILEPACGIHELGLRREFVNDISICRSALLNERLEALDFKRDYEIVL